MRKGRMTRLLALLLCGSLLLPVAVFASPGDGAEPLHTESVPEKEESGEEKREAAEKASPSELREETASGAAAAAGSASSVPSKAASPSELPGSASPSELPKGRAWSFSAFGLNAEAEGKNIGYSRSGSGALTEAGSSVTVWNLNNKGKLVPASTDGLSFYIYGDPGGSEFHADCDCCSGGVDLHQWAGGLRADGGGSGRHKRGRQCFLEQFLYGDGDQAGLLL